jgi:hypothetical protein
MHIKRSSVFNHVISISEALTSDNFLSNNFKVTVSKGAINQKFIFQTIKTQTLQTCGVACFSRSLSTPSCQFFLLNGSGVCLMGNIFTSGDNGNTQTLTAYLNDGETRHFLFYFRHSFGKLIILCYTIIFFAN